MERQRNPGPVSRGNRSTKGARRIPTLRCAPSRLRGRWLWSCLWEGEVRHALQAGIQGTGVPVGLQALAVSGALRIGSLPNGGTVIPLFA